MGMVYAHTLVTHVEARVSGALLCLLAPLRQGFPLSLEASKPELSSCFLSARVTGLFGIMPNFLCGWWRFELRTSCLVSKVS